MTPQQLYFIWAFRAVKAEVHFVHPRFARPA
jgi:hypothetical protein